MVPAPSLLSGSERRSTAFENPRPLPAQHRSIWGDQPIRGSRGANGQAAAFVNSGANVGDDG
jgi:hypothetical protein